MNDKTEQSVTDVLPCPFCGSTEGFYLEEGSTFRWRVISCRNCGEGTEVLRKNYSDDPASYIADWNAAAPYPAMLRKEIDNLRADLDRAIVNFGDAAATVCDMRAQLAEAQEQPVRHLMNPWQRAIDEALIVNGLDCTHASESPEQALARLIRAEVDMALNLPADNSSTERPDMSQTTETTLRAQLAEAQRDAEVSKQINRACMELPDDFRIAIELERNSGCVYLLQEDEDIGFDDPCDGIARSISAAIDAAKGESNA